jgi:CofH/MqnC C-terminal region
MESVDMTVSNEYRSMLSTPDLIAVGVRGDEVRQRMHGARTTFVRVFEVHVDAPVAAAPSGMAAGELRIVGRPATAERAVQVVAASTALANGRPVTGFSISDLWDLAPAPAAFAELCARLRDAGLEAVADMPIDENMKDAAGAVTAARQSGLAVERLTVHRQLDGDDARIASVERASALQDAAGGFRVFAPLPRTMSVAAPTTGYADLRQIAMARVALSNIASIQVDWPLYGPKLAQVALTVGADDVDGVPSVDAGSLGTRRSPLEEIKNNIRAAALEAVERDGRFRLLA